MPGVSVIIPAFNHAAHIGDAIRSALAQSLPPAEIIVVNDGSTDDTREVLRPYVDAGRIRYIEQENRGQAAARNRGAADAVGDYIAMLDDDDLWPRDKLQWQVETLESNGEVDLVGGTVNHDVVGAPTTTCQGEPRRITYDDIFWGCPFMSPGQVLIRRAALQEVGGMSEEIRGVEDFDLYVRMARRRPLLRVPRLALHYRLHAGNASRNQWQMLEAASICLRRRLPEVPAGRRWRMSRRAYRGLYDYLGREPVRSLQHGRVENSTEPRGSLWRLIRALGPGLLSDPRLLGRFTSDWLLRRPADGAHGK